MPSKGGINLYCAVIVKKVDAQTRAKEPASTIFCATDRRGRTRPPKPKRPQQVYTPGWSEVGRKAGDGPAGRCHRRGADGLSSGVDEDEAVRETVAILKQADLNPLDVSGYGTLGERLAEGHDIPEEERALMARALGAENSVIVAQIDAVLGGTRGAVSRRVPAAGARRMSVPEGRVVRPAFTLS